MESSESENINFILARLVVKTYRIIQTLNGGFLRDNGYDNFKIGHIGVMMHVTTNGTTAAELCKIVGISKQAMSELIKELIKKNFLELKSNPKDLRSHLLHKTKQGDDFLEVLMLSRKFIDQEFSTILTEDKLILLKELLFEVVDHFDKHSNHITLNESIIKAKL
ncbi:MarR family winged helix-turn-helix transcriptional regulator [Aquirufa sp. ROCK2-A2]